MKKNLLSGLLTLSLFATACSGTPETSDKISVVTSFYPLEFLVKEIAKDHVSLTTLVPSGVEPHDYELTPQDVGTIEESQVLIVNGVLEPWFKDVEKNLESTTVSILNMSKAMTLLDSSDPEEKGKDPHLWLDPVLMSQMADLVRDELIQADPENSTAYQSNTVVLKQKLNNLNDGYKTGLKNCAQKSFVTSHAAFAYLAQEYGLTQVAISGLSPDAEPSAQKLKEIVDFVRANKVTVIFFESLVSTSLSDTIANEVGAQTLVLNPIEGLTAAQREAGENYFNIMEENLANLKIALTCQ